MKLLALACVLLTLSRGNNISELVTDCGDRRIPNYKNICIEPIYIEGCQIYYSQETCFKCKQGYLLKENICHIQFFHPQLSKQIVGCIKYDNLKVNCQICANGFREFQGKCVQGTKNCIEYNQDGTCKQCHKQFSFLMNQCHHNEIIGCKKQNQHHQCLQCYHPFHLENARCDIKHCTKIYEFGCTACECGYYLSFNRTCQKFKKGCLRYLRGVCTDCIWHFLLKAGECQIDGCLKYHNEICQQCNLNYEKTLDGGCQFKNCYDWLNDQCLICQKGFTLQGKICVPEDLIQNICFEMIKLIGNSQSNHSKILIVKVFVQLFCRDSPGSIVLRYVSYGFHLVFCFVPYYFVIFLLVNVCLQSIATCTILSYLERLSYLRQSYLRIDPLFLFLCALLWIIVLLCRNSVVLVFKPFYQITSFKGFISTTKSLPSIFNLPAFADITANGSETQGFIQSSNFEAIIIDQCL